MASSVIQSAPLVISLLAGLLIGLTMWGFLRHYNGQEAGVAMGTHKTLLMGLSVLAVLAVSVFLAYILAR